MTSHLYSFRTEEFWNKLWTRDIWRDKIVVVLRWSKKRAGWLLLFRLLGTGSNVTMYMDMFLSWPPKVQSEKTLSKSNNYNLFWNRRTIQPLVPKQCSVPDLHISFILTVILFTHYSDNTNKHHESLFSLTTKLNEIFEKFFRGSTIQTIQIMCNVKRRTTYII